MSAQYPAVPRMRTRAALVCGRHCEIPCPVTTQHGTSSDVGHECGLVGPMLASLLFSVLDPVAAGPLTLIHSHDVASPASLPYCCCLGPGHRMGKLLRAQVRVLLDRLVPRWGGPTLAHVLAAQIQLRGKQQLTMERIKAIFVLHFLQ